MLLSLTAGAGSRDLLLLGIFRNFLLSVAVLLYAATVVHVACGFEVYGRHVSCKHVVRCVCMRMCESDSVKNIAPIATCAGSDNFLSEMRSDD